MPLDGPRKKPVQAAGPKGLRGKGSLQQAPGLAAGLLQGRDGASRVQLLKHEWWERTRGKLRAPTWPYLSQHLLLGLASRERAGVVLPQRNGVSCLF